MRFSSSRCSRRPRRRSSFGRVLGFLGAWFFITLAPTSSIIPIATEVGAERRMYLPLMALVVLAVAVAVSLWDRFAGSSETVARRPHAASVAGLALLACVAAALAAGTLARNREYSSSLRLAQTVLDRWPTSTAQHYVGEELIAVGRTDEAIAHLRQAIPGSPRAHFSLGAELVKEGRLDEGIEQLQEFVRLEPLLLEVPEAHVLIGSAYAKQQRWPEAIAQARAALMKAPRNPNAKLLLADSLFGQESLTDAIAAYRDYLSVRPADLGAVVNLGIALAASGALEEAIGIFRRVVEGRPAERVGATESGDGTPRRESRGRRRGRGARSGAAPARRCRRIRSSRTGASPAGKARWTRDNNLFVRSRSIRATTSFAATSRRS
jgi:tetratricopeptide (TPR) repeat protein